MQYILQRYTKCEIVYWVFLGIYILGYIPGILCFEMFAV